MTADEFRARASSVLLGRGWQVRLSRALGKNYDTVRNWSSGRVPVPPEVVAVIEFLETVPHPLRPARWVE
ncbi:MAG: hypothetical protein E6R03_04200 [Hyphomicrobiaceae bacterium]|nr:MAG: hypothetical protein E6R03_04200 [Hyphomicrobiaceae bacterium]